jgi:hypothetical protein
MKNILNRGFSEIPLDSFVSQVLTIIDRLTGNANFPTTDPTLTTVEAKLGELQAGMVLTDPQSRDEAIEARRAELEQMLDDLADNLEKTALMDPVKLATTGYPMHKDTEQTTAPPATPQNVRARRTDQSGQVQLLCDASARARGYEVQVATEAEAGPFTTYDTFSSTRRMFLSDFAHGKDIWIRVRAIGPNNTKSGWSTVVRILVD